MGNFFEKLPLKNFYHRTSITGTGTYKKLNKEKEIAKS